MNPRARRKHGTVGAGVAGAGATGWVRGARALSIALVLMLGVGATAAVHARGKEVPQGAVSMNLRDIIALPFTGPAAAEALDRALDMLAQADGLDPATAALLRSIDGKQAVWQAIVGYVRASRSEFLTEVVADYTRGVRSGDSGLSALFRPLVRYADGLQSDVSALQAELKRIGRARRNNSELAGRLRSVRVLSARLHEFRFLAR